MLDLPGIYMIVCRPTGELYIGATARSFRQRFAEHRNQLVRGACTAIKLQAAAALHGVDALDFIPLKSFPPGELAAREREAIEALRPALNTDGVSSRRTYGKWPRVEVGGRSLTVYQAAREFGIEANTIRRRMEKGMLGADLVAPAHKAPRKPYERRR